MAIAIAGLLLAAAAQITVPSSPPLGPLPRIATPLEYALHFKLDPAQAGFEGETQIRLRLNQAADRLWLHGKGLRVSRVEVTDAAGAVSAARYAEKHKDGVALLRFARKLPAQEITLRLAYQADYGGNLQGLYKTVHGGEAYLATQMEAVSARLAFPGFDEPAFKTPYEVSLSVPEALVAVANASQIAEQRHDGWKMLRFARTPPLPTYLIALAVGAYDVVNAPPIPANEVRATPVPLRGLAARGKGKQLKQALKQTPALFTALERYFGLPYPYDKLDLLAAPDFAWGAMENAGLITYREMYLLADDSTPAGLRQTSYNIQTHEVAHQWFGNLVTMPWWNDIWLNEAFATWIASKITHELKPEYRDNLSKLASTLHTFELDSLLSARRIRQQVDSNDDLPSAFDNITYEKGGAVLAMLENWLGADTFRDGIRRYMKRHRFGSATADDLIAALAEVSPRPEALRRVAKSFVDQPGIPLISTQLSCGAEGARLSLSQSRYLPAGSRPAGKSSWSVPVCVRTEVETVCELLEKPQQTVALAQCPDWYLPNAAAAGYYRFAMPPADFARLSAAAGSLPPLEQMIFGDAVNAGFKRGDIASAQALDAMRALADSGIAKVAAALHPSFDWIYRHMAGPAERLALARYAFGLWHERLRDLGWSPGWNESADETLLRGTLAGLLAGTARVPEIRAELLRQVEAELGDSTPLALSEINPDILRIALAVWVQERGEPAMQRLIDELARNANGQQRNAILGALGSTTDAALSQRVLALGLSESVKTGELGYIFRSHIGQVGVDKAAYWHWYRENFERLLARMPSEFRMFVVPLANTQGCSNEEAARLERFFKPRLRQIEGATLMLAQETEAIRQCAALKKKQDPAVLARWAVPHSIETAAAP